MTQHIYVDTNATAGGDGTTRAHTGANAAFASAAAAAAVVPQPLTEEVRVHFAGTIEDSTINFLSINGNSSFRLYLEADEGDDHSADGGDDGAAYDSDGFNPDVGGAWSTSHYRANSTGFLTLGIGNYTTIDRLQLRNTKSSSNAEVIRANSSNGIIQRCRLTKDGISGRGIWLSGSSVSYHTLRIFNNLIYRCASWGMNLDSRVPEDIAARVQHNTIINCGNGISLANQGNNPTFEVYNNVVVGVGAGIEYNNFDGAGMIVNATHNAGESSTAPAGHDSNWVGSITSADFEQLASVSGNYDDIDWRPTSGGLLRAAGVNQGITDGFNDTPRADPPDIGAFETATAVAPEGTGTQTTPVLEQSATALAEAANTGVQTLAFFRQAAAATSAELAPDIDMGVDFDGSTYLSRTSLTGAVDNKTILFAARVKRDVTGNEIIWSSSAASAGQSVIEIKWASDDSISIAILNATSNLILNVLSAGDELPSDGAFHSVLLSADLATGASAIVVDGTEVVYSSQSSVDENIDWTVASYMAGASAPSAGSKLNGCVGELYVTNEYLAPLGSTEGPEPLINYNRFFDANDKPIFKGSDGSNPTGTAPLVYLSGGAAQFAHNFGSGGPFTISGTLTDCPLDAGEPVGTAAQVLAALTQSASSSIQVVGVSSQELIAVEQAAASILEISASAAQELTAFEQAASSILTLLGDGTQILTPFEQEGAVTLTIEGDGVQTLSLFEQASIADLLITGAAEQILTTLTQEAAANITNEAGVGVQELPNVEQAASGEELFIGSLAQTLPVFVQNAAGEQTQLGIDGTASQELASLTQAADGVLTVSGIILQTLPSFTQAAAGELLLAGIAVQTLPVAEQSAEASSIEGMDGSATQQLAAFVQGLVGTSFVALEGEGEQVISALQQLLVGVTYEDLLGVAEQDLPALTQVSTGLLFTGVQIQTVKFALAQRDVKWLLSQREIRFILEG